MMPNNAERPGSVAVANRITVDADSPNAGTRRLWAATSTNRTSSATSQTAAVGSITGFVQQRDDRKPQITHHGDPGRCGRPHVRHPHVRRRTASAAPPAISTTAPATNGQTGRPLSPVGAAADAPGVPEPGVVSSNDQEPDTG
jgi:hypothetical protein